MSNSNATQKLFLNTRLLAVLLLGFSSGLPLALTSSTLQAWFTEAHINLVTIGALSLLGIPYTLKFFWAPLMDHYRFKYLDKRRGWILITQLALVITLLVLAQMDPSHQAATMAMMALAIAFFSASQDIAIDAYRTDILHAEERGLGSAYFIFAYRIAALLSGGLALVCADYLGWKITYEIMAILILLAMIPTFKSPSALEYQSSSQHVVYAIFASLKDLWQREQISLLFAFIVFYKLGDALALSLMTNFLLHGLGFSLTEVGVAYKLVSFIATVLGAFISGLMLTRWNIYRALLVFGLAQAVSNLMFVGLALIGKQFSFMALAIFIENFCSGMSTAAFVAFLMSLCNHRYTAGQYALLSAIASLGRVFLGPLAGWFVANWGWVDFYFLTFLLSFPGLIFLFLLKEKVLLNASTVSE